jgi:hypothetical protein
MSNNAINHDVYLLVQNGSYYITVTFMGLKIDDSFGYLSTLKYYDTGFSFDKYGNVVGTPIPAAALSYQTDAAGKYVVDAYNDASSPYPKDLRFPLVNRASYDGDFVPLQVFVPIMEAISAGSGTQDVLMRLDWTSLAASQGPVIEGAVAEEEAEFVDKAELAAALARAQKIEKGQYTDVSYDVLEAAIRAAQGVYDDEHATQKEVDAQVTALKDAIKALEKKPKKAENKKKAKNGKYEVRVDLWHATQDKPSMGNAALNHTAIIDMKDGVYTMALSTHQMQVGSIKACLMTLQVKQKSGKYTYAKIITKDNPGGKPSAFRFRLPSKNTYTAVKVDPRVEVMGDDPVDARLRISWDTLVKVSKDRKLSSNTGTTVSSSGAAIDMELSGAVTIRDEETGVTVKAGDNIVPVGAGLTASRITEGADFEKARAALSDVSDAFALFDIVLTNREGSPIQPLGSVRLSIPIPEETGGVSAVYRVNEDGTKTLIEAEEADGRVVFGVNHFSLYALASEGAETAEVVAAVSEADAAPGRADVDGGEKTPLAPAPAAADPGGVPAMALIWVAAVCAVAVAGVVLRRRVFRGR